MKVLFVAGLVLIATGLPAFAQSGPSPGYGGGYEDAPRGYGGGYDDERRGYGRGSDDERRGYGRGSDDDKADVVAQAMALIILKRAGARLKGDLIYLAAADEESGGRWGAGWVGRRFCARPYASRPGGPWRWRLRPG